MKLYGFPPSPNTRKVLALAAYLGTPLDLQLVDLTKGQQRAHDYLEMNPNGRAPTLVDGDFILWESNAIMQYLAGRKKNGAWPDDPRVRADITRWQCWQLAHWSEGCIGLTFQNMVKKLLGQGGPDAGVVQKATEAFHRDAKILDAHFAKHKFLVGDGPTLADFAVAAPLAYAGPAQMPLSDYKNIRGWLARMDALPAWQQTAPKM